MKKSVSGLLILLIKAYQQTVSPLFMPACRFTPTCSQYAIEAIKRYGPLKGAALAFRRILSCHPWGRHGVDPVP